MYHYGVILPLNLFNWGQTKLIMELVTSSKKLEQPRMQGFMFRNRTTCVPQFSNRSLWALSIVEHHRHFWTANIAEEGPLPNLFTLIVIGATFEQGKKWNGSCTPLLYKYTPDTPVYIKTFHYTIVIPDTPVYIRRGLFIILQSKVEIYFFISARSKSIVFTVVWKSPLKDELQTVVKIKTWKRDIAIMVSNNDIGHKTFVVSPNNMEWMQMYAV